MNYIFYSVIGKHAGKTPQQIIIDKQKELELNEDGKYSLWSAKIDKKSKEQVWKLSEEDTVYVLCKLNPNAKDPSGDNEIVSAKTMVTPAGEKPIPNGINTTYTKGKKNYQAYVVKKYEFFDKPQIFDLGGYESLLAKGKIVSFKERFQSTYFQNTFGRKNNLLKDHCEKEISAIMELKYPFVVDIKAEKEVL